MPAKLDFQFGFGGGGSVAAVAAPAPGELSAEDAYNAWKSDFLSEKDPIRRVARVMAAHSAVQGMVLQTQTKSVTLITEEMADCNELLKMVNNGIAATRSQPDSSSHIFSFGTMAACEALRDRFVAAGIDPALLFVRGVNPLNPEEISIGIYKKSDLNTCNSNVQLQVDSLSSTTANSNLQLQTGIGRYNGCLEVCTAAVKKAEGQAEAINHNISM